MRQHENRLRRALEDEIEQRIASHRSRGTDSILSPEVYAKVVGKIEELRSLKDTLPVLCRQILQEEDDDDD